MKYITNGRAQEKHNKTRNSALNRKSHKHSSSWALWRYPHEAKGEGGRKNKGRNEPFPNQTIMFSAKWETV